MGVRTAAAGRLQAASRKSDNTYLFSPYRLVERLVDHEREKKKGS
jgi:hypothetical protein